MSNIPLIGRLHLKEYLALAASFTLVILEVVVRSITVLLPSPIINFLYRLSRRAFNGLSSPYSRRARNRKKAVSSQIAHAEGFLELCALYGYTAEEHVVQTTDGYFLGIHRLAKRKGEEDRAVNAGPGSLQKKVVYLHHGLLMNSDVWVCITEHERCLPFALVDQGYDVWLGNNRGNKYSKKNMRYTPADIPFWSFSIDQFAFNDIPDTINYVLATTSQPSLSYIGFSQGTAQAFAALSINPQLNTKVDVFIALAPAMAPPGLASGIVSSLVKTTPEILYLIFGRRAILGSAPMWQALLYPAIFTWFVDKGLVFLFGWKTLNITPHQKLAAYPHLYSFTSTKSVVHWFQIIRNETFQMYDDEVTSPTSFSTSKQHYKVAKYPTRNIRTPIVLLYGGSDSLVDIKVMLRELPKHTIAKGIQKYEHLDFMWANDVHKLVFPSVFEALSDYGLPSDSKRDDASRSRMLLLNDRASSQAGMSQPPNYFEDGDSTAAEQMDETDNDDEELLETPAHEIGAFRYRSPTTVRSATTPFSEAAQLTFPGRNRDRTSTVDPIDTSLDTIRQAVSNSNALSSQTDATSWLDSPAVTPNAETEDTLRTTRPEGWWSSTNSALSSAGPTPAVERTHLFN
jgi:lysosomal acid lipase/cholesteryl ester hydrolase